MATSAGKLGDRFLADIVEEFGIAVGNGNVKEHPLVTEDRGHLGTEAVLEDILRPDFGESFL